MFHDIKGSDSVTFSDADVFLRDVSNLFGNEGNFNSSVNFNHPP